LPNNFEKFSASQHRINYIKDYIIAVPIFP
jgi:hypothetical protein